MKVYDRVMGLKKHTSRLRIVLCFSAVSALMVAAASGAFAQDGANEQVPPSFPSMIDEPPAATTQSNQIISQQQATQAAAMNPAQRAANAAAQTQAAAPASETTEQSDATAVTPAEPIPAQPEERRLVPATPMGSAAQAVGQSDPVDEANVPNPVEDAAAAAALEQEPAAPPPTSDILEKYTAKADALQSISGVEPDVSGDALPQGSQPTQLTLEGVGFDNMANKSVKVPVGGGLEEEQNKEELQAEIRDEAFDAAITGMFPLTPEQIQMLLKRYDSTQGAAQKPPYDLPTPEISVQNVSLDPGVMPPVVKTAVGNVTTINVLDATGAPWPVQDVTWAGDFEVVEPEEGGHIIRITPMAHQARGNIVIRLLTLKTPLTMTLATSRETVQYRIDARVPEYGPFASAPLMTGGKVMVAGDSAMTSVLDGVPGTMAKLEVAGVDGRTTAYSNGDITYVRTPLTLLSPAWQSSVSSADGMNVYALANAPVLLLSDEGNFVRATLTQKEGLLDD